MDKTFLASKKIILVGIILIFAFLILYIIYENIFDVNGSNKIASLILNVVTCLSVFKLSSFDYKSKIRINDFGIGITNYKLVVKFSWDEIYNVEYKGAKWNPIYEKIIIHGDNRKLIEETKLIIEEMKILPILKKFFIRGVDNKIKIDYYFKDYLTIWREVINECKTHNPDILIDERIEKRLSQYEKKL